MITTVSGSKNRAREDATGIRTTHRENAFNAFRVEIRFHSAEKDRNDDSRTFSRSNRSLNVRV